MVKNHIFFLTEQRKKKSRSVRYDDVNLMHVPKYKSRQTR